MRDKIEQILIQFIAAKTNVANKVVDRQSEVKSHLIEIVGATGTGKTQLCQQIQKLMQNHHLPYSLYVPRVFGFNQLQEILTLATGIDEDEYHALLESARPYHTGRKYDFFYFLSEKLNERQQFKPVTILIDDCELLDQYTRDFIQYLVQYAEDASIHIIAFTRQKTFPFSDKENLDYLGKEDIKRLLHLIFTKTKSEFASESEILKSITDGNLYLLENILTEILSRGKTDKIILDEFIEKHYEEHELYLKRINNVTPSQQDLLFYIYLLDGLATDDNIEVLLKSKTLKKDIKELSEQYLIYKANDIYVIAKLSAFQKSYEEKAQEEKDLYLSKVFNFLKGSRVPLSVLVNYLMLQNQLEERLYEEVINHLHLLCDHQSVLDILQFQFKLEKDPLKQLELLKRIGISYKDMSQREMAAECFRKCLHLCTENSYPAEEIIYHLADSLFAINSVNFAIEMINKYSPTSIDATWKAKLLILKAEILMEADQFDEATSYHEEALKIATKIEDKNQSYILQAEAKKIKGKVFYYVNEWEKSETAFKESESLFKMANYTAGLAAINNNLGVVYMFQGEWEKSEQFYLKSLELEKGHYNLNGVSVCYNNLGALMDDKGDQQKSLYYLEEALKIQKLLSDPYNITNIYNNIGVTYMDQAEYNKAEEAFHRSMETSISFNFYKNIIASLNNLGSLYFKKGDWNKSIDFYERAIERSKENDFVEGLLRSYNNLGEVYEKRGELNLAYDLYFKGQELIPQISDDYMKAELWGNLGSVLTKLHKFSEAYAYLVESFDFFKALNAKNQIIEGCQKQAYYFLITRNYESADYYLNIATKNAKELNSNYELGKILYLRALLDRKNTEKARKHLEEAIQLFHETKNNYELSFANYEYASILYEEKDWEQALQILKANRKIIQQFGLIKLLEQNDMLQQKISKEYSTELKDAKLQEDLLNQFYEITQNLNSISDLEVMMESALDNLVTISEADGGILCLYNNSSVPEGWEYKVFNNYSHDDKHYETIMDVIQQSYSENTLKNYKQPYFAPRFNNIVCFPLSIRNTSLGTIMLFSKHGTHYFPERILNLINALCNQIIVIIENIRSSNLEKSHAIIREQLNTSNLYSNIIGKSPKMMQIFSLIERIKDTPTTVLLEGPSGTGKELIARAIHYSSNRRNKAFVAQYCGALPETLLESELFGHVKGSFTGAAYDKKGLFEIADGGTFFLDEIADISLSTQAKLLRFLQEGEIKRVGSTKTEKVDVRVVCATNVSLIEKVQRGEFRLDLYYRLNVIRLEVPSLKERKTDIPLLGIHFLDKYNKRINKAVAGITDEAMKCLTRYDWPGNVRQLENEIERAVTLAENNSFIKPSDLSDEVFKFVEHTQAISLISKKQTLKDAVEDLERKMLTKALEESGWNQTQAAKELGLSRQGLIKKMKRYNLFREGEEIDDIPTDEDEE